MTHAAPICSTILSATFQDGLEPLGPVKGNVVKTNVYHKYIKDLKLNITIDLDGFVY